MAPVDSSPSCFPASLNPLSPVLIPPASQPTSTPVFSHPATPWPHAASHQTDSSPSNSSSPDPVYPPLSAVSGRRRQNRSSSSSSTAAASLDFVHPSPSPSSSHPFPTDFQQSVGNLISLPSSPPSLVSSIPDEAPFGPVGTALRSCSLFSAESSLMIRPSSVVLPVTECIGDPSISKLQPCPVGPSSCSSGSPSCLGIRQEEEESEQILPLERDSPPSL